MSAPRVIKRTPDLGLKIRLQPVVEVAGVAAPGGCPCEATGVEWAVVPSYRTEDWGDGPVIYPDWPYPELRTGSAAAWTLHQQVNHGGSYVYPTYRVLGLPIGSAIGGVSWLLEWVAPATNGVTADASGPVLTVSIPPMEPHAGLPSSTLIARAYCGDAAVGELRLDVVREYDPS